MLSEFQSPDVLVALIAILTLLVVWQYYKMQIMAGRILAVDIFDRSGVRMYLYATSNDGQACKSCSAANGRVFLPSMVAKDDFSPLEAACIKPTPCTGVLVGLYGGWLEARRVLDHLRSQHKQGHVHLALSELQRVVDGPWERSVSAETDRLSMYMLSAMLYEEAKQDVAIGNYGYVIEHAKDVQHLTLLVPAFLRLTQLLVRAERWAEALKVIEQFESRFPSSGAARHFPSVKQRDLMRIMKTQVLKSQLMQMTA
jgi:hypothetical protein